VNAYLHIPFCASICSYCDFTSFAGQDSKVETYTKALVREIEGSSLLGPLRTVYFGGGTPSVLSSLQLEAVLNALRNKAGFDPQVEISLEANPETVTLEKMTAYRSLGVNRVSFGAQASQEKILRRLGRGHSWDQVEKAFLTAREAGFANLNLDLMFGLPGQTPEDFKESLQKAAALKPDHLSVYALQVEEGTPLAKQVQAGLALPSEDEMADEYAQAQSFLKSQGFEQYEVSNFARAGKSCRHNWNIWRGQDYWGFGLSAVGTVQGVRHTHDENLIGYLETAVGLQSPALSLEFLSPEVLEFEKIMLALRTSEGVSRRDLDHYAKSQGLSYQERFRLFESRGWLHLEGDHYRVTPSGFFVLNGLLETLVA
jgi:oxygen-independent coproporphyrinogen-3 oxidase